ncbi:60S acidic ribosomal protein P1-like [Dromiciops gliroides]|uniref:60S acidic ribosomal protein P1-like n=1 Tax=Dromiciops gliroides TaxID=33562 RepID=UPI001CC78BB4|nr:60S acidic ribosomal protein P1-like [Dromiciops gliroides]
MAVSELTCIYSALILQDDEVMVTALNNVNIASLICNVGVGGPAPAAGGAAPAEEKKKEEAKKEESEESDDDMGFGLFD